MMTETREQSSEKSEKVGTTNDDTPPPSIAHRAPQSATYLKGPSGTSYMKLTVDSTIRSS